MLRTNAAAAAAVNVMYVVSSNKMFRRAALESVESLSSCVTHHGRCIVYSVFIAEQHSCYLLWPPNRADHYISPLWCLLSFFLLLSFPLAYSQRSQIGCLSANLEWRSEMCCTRLAENTGCKITQKFAICALYRTRLSGSIFATKACIDNRKKC